MHRLLIEDFDEEVARENAAGDWDRDVQVRYMYNGSVALSKENDRGPSTLRDFVLFCDPIMPTWMDWQRVPGLPDGAMNEEAFFRSMFELVDNW